MIEGQVSKDIKSNAKTLKRQKVEKKSKAQTVVNFLAEILIVLLISLSHICESVCYESMLSEDNHSFKKFSVLFQFSSFNVLSVRGFLDVLVSIRRSSSLRV